MIVGSVRNAIYFPKLPSAIPLYKMPLLSIDVLLKTYLPYSGMCCPLFRVRQQSLVLAEADRDTTVQTLLSALGWTPTGENRYRSCESAKPGKWGRGAKCPRSGVAATASVRPTCVQRFELTEKRLHGACMPLHVPKRVPQWLPMLTLLVLKRRSFYPSPPPFFGQWSND